MMLSLIALASLLALVLAQDIDPATIQATLLKDGVIPDVLPSNFTDILPFDVSFFFSFGRDWNGVSCVFS
jgi:hypothetical protein